jgi:hypothetical protein
MLLAARVDHLKQRAEARLAEGDARGALQAYRDAVAAASASAAASSSTTSRLELAILHCNASAVALPTRPREALDHAESALEASPRLHKAHWRRGRALLALGRRPEAAAAFAAAAAAVAAAQRSWQDGSGAADAQLARECAAACWDAVARQTHQEVADELLRLLGGGGGGGGGEGQPTPSRLAREALREAAFALVKASGRPTSAPPPPESSHRLHTLAPSAPGYYRLLLHRWLLLLPLPVAPTRALCSSGAAACEGAAADDLITAHERAALMARLALATGGDARHAAAAARSAAERAMSALGSAEAAAAARPPRQAEEEQEEELLGAALAEACLLQGHAWSRWGQAADDGARLTRVEAARALEAYELASALAAEEDKRGEGGQRRRRRRRLLTTFARPVARQRVARVERLLLLLLGEDEEDGDDADPVAAARALALTAAADHDNTALTAAATPPLLSLMTHRPLPALPYAHYRLVDGRGLPVERPDKHPFALSRVAYGGERGAAAAALAREEDVWAEMSGVEEDEEEEEEAAASPSFLLRGRLRWRQTAAAVVLRLARSLPAGSRAAVTLEPYRVRVDAVWPAPTTTPGGSGGALGGTIAVPPRPPLPLLDAALERAVSVADSTWSVEEQEDGGGRVVEIHLSKLNLELLAAPHRHADTWWPRLFHAGGGGVEEGSGGDSQGGALVVANNDAPPPDERARVAFDDYMKDYRDLPAMAMASVAQERARQTEASALAERDEGRRQAAATRDAARRRRRCEVLEALRCCRG